MHSVGHTIRFCKLLQCCDLTSIVSMMGYLAYYLTSYSHALLLLIYYYNWNTDITPRGRKILRRFIMFTRSLYYLVDAYKLYFLKFHSTFFRRVPVTSYSRHQIEFPNVPLQLIDRSACCLAPPPRSIVWHICNC